MFCTRCGTQIEPADNFCRNCGARLRRSAESSSSEASTHQAEPAVSSVTTPGVVPPGSTKPTPFPRTPERKAISAVTIIGCLVALVIAGGAWMYFATDPFREPIKQESPVVSEGQGHRDQAPGALLPQRTNDPGEAADNKFASVLQPPRSSPADPIESSNPASNPLPKPAPKTGISAPSHTANVQSPAQQAPTPARANKTAAPVSRRATAAGTYETTRSTPLFEAPTANSAVIANIPGGMRLSVVNSTGDWLEVHSKRGNPPGYIRRQDATFISKAD